MKAYIVFDKKSADFIKHEHNTTLIYLHAIFLTEDVYILEKYLADSVHQRSVRIQVTNPAT